MVHLEKTKKHQFQHGGSTHGDSYDVDEDGRQDARVQQAQLEAKGAQKRVQAQGRKQEGKVGHEDSCSIIGRAPVTMPAHSNLSFFGGGAPAGSGRAQGHGEEGKKRELCRR